MFSFPVDDSLDIIERRHSMKKEITQSMITEPSHQERKDPEEEYFRLVFGILSGFRLSSL